MKINIENTDPCRRKMHLVVDADAVMPEYNTIVKEFSKAAKVPGFRKGKTPQDVVERRYADQIKHETKDRLVPRFYREALEQHEISPVAIVQVSDVSFSKQEGITFDVTFDVAPIFKLPKYRKISLKSKPVEITNDQVEKAFERLLNNAARFEDVAGRAVKEADLVMIDYSGTCEEKPISEFSPECEGIGSGKDFWTLVGEPELLPGFVKELEGMDVGQEKEINVHFPDDFRVPAVSGKDAVYKVLVKGLREKKLPDIDEKFLKQFEADSEEALKNRIREDLVKSSENIEKDRLKKDIVEYLVSKTKIDLPQSIVEEETRNTARNMVQRMAMEGATQQQIEGQQQDILNSATESSANRVKTSYILDRIAEEENVQVEDSEVDEHVNMMAARYGMPAAQFRAEMEKRNSMDGIKDNIRNDKTLNFLLDNAKIKK